MYLISSTTLAKCANTKYYKSVKIFNIHSDLIRTRKEEHEEFTLIGSSVAHWQGTSLKCDFYYHPKDKAWLKLTYVHLTAIFF